MTANPPARQVAVIVDSAASVPPDFDRDSRTFTVPMLLHVGGATFKDGVDIAPSEFYSMQRQYAGETSTSAPTPGDFLEAYRAASQVAGSAICITVSDTFSATKSSADAAREQFLAERSDFQIEVVDSQSAAGGEGLIAWEALKSIRDGADLSLATNRSNWIADRIRLLAYVDTLYYLWKGGRVPRIAHTGVSLLKLKPIFELYRSEVNSLARPRTNSRATSKLVGLMADRVGNSDVHAVVMHASAPDEVQVLKSHISERFNCAELYETEFTPVMGAHIGPGMVGVAFWSE